MQGLQWTVSSSGGAAHVGPMSFSMPASASTDAVMQASKAGASLNKSKVTLYTHGGGPRVAYLVFDLSDATVAGDQAHASPLKTGAAVRLTVTVKHVGISNVASKNSADVF